MKMLRSLAWLLLVSSATQCLAAPTARLGLRGGKYNNNGYNADGTDAFGSRAPLVGLENGNNTTHNLTTKVPLAKTITVFKYRPHRTVTIMAEPTPLAGGAKCKGGLGGGYVTFGITGKAFEKFKGKWNATDAAALLFLSDINTMGDFRSPNLAQLSGIWARGDNTNRIMREKLLALWNSYKSHKGSPGWLTSGLTVPMEYESVNYRPDLGVVEIAALICGGRSALEFWYDVLDPKYQRVWNYIGVGWIRIRVNLYSIKPVVTNNVLVETTTVQVVERIPEVTTQTRTYVATFTSVNEPVTITNTITQTSTRTTTNKVVSTYTTSIQPDQITQPTRTIRPPDTEGDKLPEEDVVVCMIGFYVGDTGCVPCPPVDDCVLVTCTSPSDAVCAVDGCEDQYYNQNGACIPCAPVPNCRDGHTLCSTATDSFCQSKPCHVSGQADTCDCNAGYVVTSQGQCVNVNECASNTDTCAPVATCKDTIGSYTCTCPPGYVGNGITCQKTEFCGLYGQKNPAGTITVTEGVKGRTLKVVIDTSSVRERISKSQIAVACRLNDIPNVSTQGFPVPGQFSKRCSGARAPCAYSDHSIRTFRDIHEIDISKLKCKQLYLAVHYVVGGESAWGCGECINNFNTGAPMSPYCQNRVSGPKWAYYIPFTLS